MQEVVNLYRLYPKYNNISDAELRLYLIKWGQIIIFFGLSLIDNNLDKKAFAKLPVPPVINTILFLNIFNFTFYFQNELFHHYQFLIFYYNLLLNLFYEKQK